jgi:hypothetical protein
MNVLKANKTAKSSAQADYFNKFSKSTKFELAMKLAENQVQLDTANDVIDRIDNALQPKWFKIALNIVGIIRLILDLILKYKGLFR